MNKIILLITILALNSCDIQKLYKQPINRNLFTCLYLGGGYRRCENQEIICYQILDGNFNILSNICKFKQV